MKKLNITIAINPDLYLKNPDLSDLGKRIISNSIHLIDELGFEKFTFRKLSVKINSPESSIYRYFENKHQLLVYLTSWYWSWIYYRITMAVINIESPKIRLVNAIRILTTDIQEDLTISYVNEVQLNKIIITESVKAIHTKDVDKENEIGCFEAYKRVINKVAEIVLEINPKFQYSHMLITTVIEGAQQQHYYVAHLPSLTDNAKNEDVISEFYMEMIFKMIE